MEIEENRSLPFLDILITRNMDGTLGHAVYRKRTHTDLYLNANSCHHPAQRNSVLNTLVHRARSICDKESLPGELQHLKDTFKKNGYSENQIRRALKNDQKKKEERPEEDEAMGCAFLPYVGPPTAKIARILKKHKVKTVFRTAGKIKDLLGSTKDPLGLTAPGVYKIGCECGMQYIGQTQRCISQRRNEHIRHVRLGQTNKSAVAEHSLEEKHTFNFEETKKICSANGFWDSVIKESIEIRLHDNLINRDSGYHLSTAWEPVIRKMREERSRPPRSAPGADGGGRRDTNPAPASPPPPATPGTSADSAGA